MAFAGDRIIYVSKSGNNANDGLTEATAVLTVANALTKLGGNAGTVCVGAGTYDEGPVLNGNQTIKGQGRYSTVFRLTANGTLINANTLQNGRYESVGFTFNTGITGTLVALANCFHYDFVDCRFSGTSISGQTGVSFTSNTGDCHFERCYWTALNIGVDTDSVMNYIFDSVFSDFVTAGIYGGDPTTDNQRAGISVTNTIFKGTSPRDVHCRGRAQSWFFDKCWWDTHATTAAIEVGTGTKGPWMFSVTNSGCIAGQTNSMVVNAAERVLLDNNVFGNNGSNPTALTVNSTNAATGHLGTWRSQGVGDISTMIPATWTRNTSQPRVTVATASRTAGDVAITSTSLTAVDTALDLTLNAKAGDWVEITRNAQCTNQAIVMDWAYRLINASTSATIRDVAVAGWTLRGGDYFGAACPVGFVVQAGDLVSGQIKLRLMAKLGSAGTRTIFAGSGATPALTWWAKNYGPQTSP
jgi:hypothetical protein